MISKIIECDGYDAAEELHDFITKYGGEFIKSEKHSHWQVKLIIVPPKESEPFTRCPVCGSEKYRIIYFDDEKKDINFFDCLMCRTHWDENDMIFDTLPRKVTCIKCGVEEAVVGGYCIKCNHLAFLERKMTREPHIHTPPDCFGSDWHPSHVCSSCHFQTECEGLNSHKHN